MLLLTGQKFLLQDKIPPNAKRILLIYRARPQLGDSIQELSGRVQLQAPGRTIDCYTERVIADVYAGDTIFNKVFSDDQALVNNYDFVILMTMSWKNIGPKVASMPFTPFAVVYGYSHGIELDQLGLSYGAFSRMNGVERPSSCKAIFNLKYSHDAIARDKHAIAIAVGGVGSNRIYRNWPKVVELLIQTNRHDPNFKVFLLGSDNGRAGADEILLRVNHDPRVHDLVGKTVLEESFSKLKQVSLLLCADGGLMHIASCAETPLVSLFSGVIHPLFRLKRHAPAIALHADREVSEIPPEHIARIAISASKHPPQKLSMQFLGSEPDHF